MNKTFIMKSNICELARVRGFYTPESLARVCGLTKSTIYNVWSGDLSCRQFKTMIVIAESLGVPIQALYERETTNE